MTNHPFHRRQRTLQLKCSIDGVGLHSGRAVRLTLHPAPVDSGIVFVRTDLPHVIEVPARTEYVVDTLLNTTLGRGESRIGTVEHLLAALYGLGVDNVRVEVDGPEIPVLDGSSHEFVNLLKTAGIRDQRASRTIGIVRRPVEVVDGEKRASVSPSSAFFIDCAIDFKHPLITNQRFSMEVTSHTFAREIAKARTFGFIHEVEGLRAKGLALGGSLENAIVVDEFNILNPGGLRFPDEFVRHKILDAIGDLALVGMPVLGRFEAVRTGHALNHRLVEKLINEPGALQIVTVDDFPIEQPAAPVEISLGQLEGSLA